MTVYYPPKNYSDDFQQRPDSLGKYLGSEKERIAMGIEELKKEIREEWNKKYFDSPVMPNWLSSVNLELLDFMLSFRLTDFYNNLSKKFNLNDNQRNVLPNLIWKIVINKNWNDIISILENNLAISANISSQIYQLLNESIISKARELAEKPFTPRKTIAAQAVESKKIKMTVSQALQKYPRLGEQLVTGNPIKLKIFPEPARPSVKNWIADYHQTIGTIKGGMMERGNFLFHSENAKKLTAGERQKLAMVLKSLDENEPVAVDAEKQEIVFPHPEILSPPAGGERGTGGEGVRFSYPQKMAVERNIQPEIRKQPAPPPPPELWRASPPPPPKQTAQSASRFSPKTPEHEFRPCRIYPISPNGMPKDSGNPNGSAKEKPEPRVEGNVVDLRNQEL